MSNIQDFRRYEANHKTADNFKMVMVGILVLSVIVFSGLGKDDVKPIIIHWAVFMSSLVIISLILDYRARKKDKKKTS